MLKIRLSRGGATHSPFYSILIAEARSQRGKGKKIGFFNPLIKKGETKGTAVRCNIDLSELKHWLSVGAVPTETVIRVIEDYSDETNSELLVEIKKLLPKYKSQAPHTKTEFSGMSKKNKKEVLTKLEEEEKQKKLAKEAAAKEAAKQKEAQVA